MLLFAETANLLLQGRAGVEAAVGWCNVWRGTDSHRYAIHFCKSIDSDAYARTELEGAEADGTVEDENDDDEYASSYEDDMDDIE